MRARRTTRGRRPRRGACARRPEECRPRHERQQENIHPAVGRREQVTKSRRIARMTTRWGRIIDRISICCPGTRRGARRSREQRTASGTGSDVEGGTKRECRIVQESSDAATRPPPPRLRGAPSLALPPPQTRARVTLAVDAPPASARRVHSHKKRSSRRSGAPPRVRPRSRRRRRGGPPSARRASLYGLGAG